MTTQPLAENPFGVYTAALKQIGVAADRATQATSEAIRVHDSTTEAARRRRKEREDQAAAQRRQVLSDAERDRSLGHNRAGQMLTHTRQTLERARARVAGAGLGRWRAPEPAPVGQAAGPPMIALQEAEMRVNRAAGQLDLAAEQLRRGLASRSRLVWVGVILGVLLIAAGGTGAYVAVQPCGMVDQLRADNQLCAGASVRGVALNPDGKLLASTGDDGKVLVWDVATQRRTMDVGNQGSKANAVSFSPSGWVIATGGADGSVGLWNLLNNKNTLISAHPGGVFQIVFNHDGSLMATAGNDGTVKLWDIAIPQAIRTLNVGGKGAVYSVAFSPDGVGLATTNGDSTVKLWLAATGVNYAKLAADGEVLTVAYRPDGWALASAGSDGVVTVWDLGQQKPLARLVGQPVAVIRSVAFSPDGRQIVAGSDDGVVRVWDVEGEKVIAEFRKHSGSVQQVAFLPDGKRVVSAGTDKRILFSTIP